MPISRAMKLHCGRYLKRKRPEFPSGTVLGLGLSMGSWISQRKQCSKVVFVSDGPLARSVGL
jgi:hypothetical protein